MIVNRGRQQKFFQRGQRRHFAYTFQVADSALKKDVHKTLYPFCTMKKMLNFTVIVTKNELRWQQKSGILG